MPSHHSPSRRAFLQGGVLTLTTATMLSRSMADELEPPRSRIGLITDLHYADKPTAGTRHYRDTLAKLEQASKEFAAKPLDFVVELGDLIDAAESVETELGYLETINERFAAISEHRHYVLGNHCVDTLTKAEFLGKVGQEKSYYSFDHGGFHFIVLDACFRSDGTPYERKNFQWTDANVSAAELEWLAEDLAGNQLPTIVFAHQRLDTADNHGVKNNEQVRDLFSEHGNVAAVFQGHSHQNDHREINGIHYVTLVAMVEGPIQEHNGFSILELHADSSLRLHGFRDQADYDWELKD
ncbi:MAG: metallophosphoesterase [Planctomycetales bacterium]|nr:metallophosphoesterase [Planctomycetales bacterium]